MQLDGIDFAELTDAELELIVAGKTGGGSGGARRSGGGGNALNFMERLQRISRNSTENNIREADYRRSLGLRYGS